jgi:1-phosphatidylinositol phosphodiesterase
MAPSYTGRGWMGALDGGTLLSALSIPGSHDSGALHEPLRGTSRCQNLAIAEQLAIGVRYLDIRCRNVDNLFKIYHGRVSQQLNFEDVLTACTSFLSENATECIIMSVKQETAPARSTRSFEEIFDWYVAKDPKRWQLSPKIPAMKEAAAKIVLLRQFSTTNSPKGIDATNWPVNATFTIDGEAKLSIQDDYIVPDTSAKLALIKRHYREAAAARDDALYLNFTSGYKPGFLGLPDITFVSDRINPAVADFFAANLRGRFGISVIDFVDPALCTRIIATNFAES